MPRFEGGQRDQSGTIGPVTKLQMQLRALGLPAGPIDGQFTEKTRRAIEVFQNRRGLEPTGRLDEQTAEHLASVTLSLANGQPTRGFSTDPALVQRLLSTKMVPVQQAEAKAVRNAINGTEKPRLFRKPLFWLVAGTGAAAAAIAWVAGGGSIKTIGQRAFEELEDATGLDFGDDGDDNDFEDDEE